jgi:polyphenol oxidase
MLNKEQFIVPQWPVPIGIKALVTTRYSTHNGISLADYKDFNLAMHVGDNSDHVEYNRELLNKILPQQPIWLNQIHSQRIIEIDDSTYLKDADGYLSKSLENADGSFTLSRNQVCAVMTADCLPILFSSEGGEIVAAIHVGWRGLALGIIDTTVQFLLNKLSIKGVLENNQLLAWLGPAISKNYFEVGEEVKVQFLTLNPDYKEAFTSSEEPQKFMADIYQLARINLQKLGVTKIYGGNFCTYEEKDKFFSYRRDGITGRMASLIWKEK